MGFNRTATGLQETMLGPLEGGSIRCWGGCIGDKDGCQEQASCVLGLGPGLGSCFREQYVLGVGVHGWVITVAKCHLRG